MQIRISNKQDEADVRTLISAGLEEEGRTLDLNGADHDLRKMEAHYFGHDGVVLVAEVDHKIIAVACAIKKTEMICELKRLYVGRDSRRQGVGSRMLKQVVDFARGLGYEKLSLPANHVSKEFFLAQNFQQHDDQLERDLG